MQAQVEESHSQPYPSADLQSSKPQVPFEYAWLAEQFGKRLPPKLPSQKTKGARSKRASAKFGANLIISPQMMQVILPKRI